jgi:hypothetical protein
MAKSRKRSKRASELPDERIPIVDAVVEMVFARLREAAAVAKRSARAKKSRPEASAAPHPSLAESLADILLSDLSRVAAKSAKKSKSRRKGARKRVRSSRIR